MIFPLHFLPPVISLVKINVSSFLQTNRIPSYRVLYVTTYISVECIVEFYNTNTTNNFSAGTWNNRSYSARYISCLENVQPFDSACPVWQDIKVIAGPCSTMHRTMRHNINSATHCIAWNDVRSGITTDAR